MANGHGGYREGAGRKPADYQAPQAKLDYEAERALHDGDTLTFGATTLTYVAS